MRRTRIGATYRRDSICKLIDHSAACGVLFMLWSWNFVVKQLHIWVVENSCGIYSFIEQTKFRLTYKSGRFCSYFAPWCMASHAGSICNNNLSGKVEEACQLDSLTLDIHWTVIACYKFCLRFPRQARGLHCARKHKIGTEENTYL
jgi:hypothetical protein